MNTASNVGMDSDYVKYSIIIPAYNERERIAASLEKIISHTTKQGWPAEILVVNDGSRDGTAEVVREFALRNPAIRLIENPGNRGKGYSVRNGMRNAHGDVLLFTDADLSSPIQEAEKLFAALEAGADIAIGSRWLNPRLQTQRQSALRQLYGRVFNLLLRIILGLRQKDTQCGFKAFNARAAEAVFSRQRVEGWGFDPELLFLAQKLGFKIAEVAVEWAHDHRSKIHPVRDGARMFRDLFSVRWNWMLGRYRTPQALAAATADKKISVA